MKQLRFFEIASGSQAPLGNPLIEKLLLRTYERKKMLLGNSLLYSSRGEKQELLVLSRSQAELGNEGDLLMGNAVVTQAELGMGMAFPSKAWERVILKGMSQDGGLTRVFIRRPVRGAGVSPAIYGA